MDTRMQTWSADCEWAGDGKVEKHRNQARMDTR